MKRAALIILIGTLAVILVACSSHQEVMSTLDEQIVIEKYGSIPKTKLDTYTFEYEKWDNLDIDSVIVDAVNVEKHEEEHDHDGSKDTTIHFEGESGESLMIHLILRYQSCLTMYHA